MRLIVTRHGETKANRDKILQGQLPGVLTAKGVEQATRLGKRLEREKIDYIFSSDLKRVVDTTREILNYKKDVPVEYTQLLRERDLGELQGKAKKELYTEGKESVVLLDNKIGETDKDVFKRACLFFDRLKNESYENKCILIVCHGRLGKLLIAAIKGIDYLEAEEMDNLYNTSISIFNVKGGTTETECLNDIGHLA